MAADGKYNDDEVRTIIDRALRGQQGRDVSHEELLAVASEVGISRESIELAAREVEQTRETQVATERVLARRRRTLASHIWTFVAINGFLFAINFLSTPGQWWVLFPLMSWGLGLVFHARAALSKHVSPRALRRERERMQAELSPGTRVEQRVESAAAAPGGARAQDAAAPRVRVGGPSATQNDEEAEDEGLAGTSQRKRHS